MLVGVFSVCVDGLLDYNVFQLGVGGGGRRTVIVGHVGYPAVPCKWILPSDLINNFWIVHCTYLGVPGYNFQQILYSFVWISFFYLYKQCRP